MKVLELFSGTRSIGEAFEKRGHEVFSVEWDESLPADLHADIEFLKAPDVLRAFGPTWCGRRRTAPRSPWRAYRATGARTPTPATWTP